MTDDENRDMLEQIADYFVRHLAKRKLVFACAESCTGGMVASAITAIAGASDVFDRGFVTYSNDAKSEMLGIDSDMIMRHGAVSSEVAGAMAENALERSNGDIAISITGIAGPSGGTEEKPVGLVWFACALGGRPTFVTSHVFEDHGRAYIRHQAAIYAMQMTLQIVTDMDQFDGDDTSEPDDWTLP